MLPLKLRLAFQGWLSPVASIGGSVVNRAFNSASVACDFLIHTAANDFRVDSDGWFQISPYGEFKHSKGLQVFERADADRIVSAFNANTNKSVGDILLGLPLYRGHPDGAPELYPDDQAVGRIKELAARNDGLWGKLKLNRKGKDLIEDEVYSSHSPYWAFNHDTNRRGAIRPNLLLSVGLTNQPNIKSVKPIAANTENMNDLLKKIAIALALAETSTEAEVIAKVAANSTELTTAKTKLTETEGLLVAANASIEKHTKEVTALNGKLSIVQSEMTAANGKVTTLTSERDMAANALKAERAARVKIVADAAINSATITAAQRPTFEAELISATDETAFNSVCTRMKTNPTKLFTQSVAKLQTAANGKGANPGWGKFHEDVRAKESAGASYGEAWNSCKEMPEHKGLFAETAVA